MLAYFTDGSPFECFGADVSDIAGRERLAWCEQETPAPRNGASRLVAAMLTLAVIAVPFAWAISA